jgi:hypothetical protein
MDFVVSLDSYGRGPVQRDRHLVLASVTNVIGMLNFFHL